MRLLHKPSWGILDFGKQSREGASREATIKVVERLGQAELGGWSECFFQRAAGEVDKDIGRDGVNAAGGDYDCAGLGCKEIISSSEIEKPRRMSAILGRVILAGHPFLRIVSYSLGDDFLLERQFSRKIHITLAVNRAGSDRPIRVGTIDRIYVALRT